MGLIKAMGGSTRGVLADSWRDFFYCESLDASTLASKGQKKTGNPDRSSNAKGDENVISNGSIVAINDGQCMIIVESGAVVDLCAEPGEYLYETSSEPSVFYGPLGANVKSTFKEMQRRIGFGGSPGKDQRVYYFNIKEIVGNKYGTPNPVPFRVVDANIGLDIDIAVRCNDEYSYRIDNPLLFYRNVCGNVETTYTKDQLDSQLKSELLTALQPAFSRISAAGVRYSNVPAHTRELAALLNEELTDTWRSLRGMSVVSFGMNSIRASEEDELVIKRLQSAAVMRDPNMAAANLVAAQSDAMRIAAGNANGAANGFIGLGLANMTGGTDAGRLFTDAATSFHHSGSFNQQNWTCSCGVKNSGNFCQNCGKERCSDSAWTCPSCGTSSAGNYCSQCGKARTQP